MNFRVLEKSWKFVSKKVMNPESKTMTNFSRHGVNSIPDLCVFDCLL